MKLLKSGRPFIDKKKALDIINQDEMMKINMNITKKFHKEIKLFALENDITLTELIHRSLKNYINK